MAQKQKGVAGAVIKAGFPMTVNKGSFCLAVSQSKALP